MVKMLELSDTEAGTVMKPAYQSEVFEWVQNPDGWCVPRLQLGHKAVLSAAFDGKSLLTIAHLLNDIEDPNNKTGAQLVVAGIDYSVVEASEIAPDLDSALVAVGALPRAHKYARYDEETAGLYGFSDVFTNSNYRANEGLSWFEGRSTAQPTMLNDYARNRITNITKDGDAKKARDTIDRIRNIDHRLARLLLAGFRSPVLLSDYEQPLIQQTAEKVSHAIEKRYAIPAASVTRHLLDFKRAEYELGVLSPRENWGTDVACEKKDDPLLETRSGKSSVDPRARLLCGSCAVRLYCLRDALYDDAGVVRGGLSGAERRRLRKSMGLEELEIETEREGELPESA